MMVEAADAAIDANPTSARGALAELGARPWFRAPDHQRIAYGFALRSYAAWLDHDLPSARADLINVSAVSPLSDPLLPLVPVLCGADGLELDGQVRTLIDRFGGCGRPSCGHDEGLEAGLAVLRQATASGPLLRWAVRTAGLPHEDSVRITAFGRAWQLGDREEAESVLSGPGDRLRTARARVFYDTGRHHQVLETMPPEHDLAIRSTLSLLLQGEVVPDAYRLVVEQRAMGDGVVAALIAEAEGRFADAAEYWGKAGDAVRSWEAAALSDATHVGAPPDAPGVDSSTLWYTHAAGSTPQPASPPVSQVDAHNAKVARKRAELLAARTGRSLPDRSVAEPAILNLQDALEALRESPGRAGSMLAVTMPDSPAVDLLASLAAAPQRRGARPGSEWETWSDAHLDVRPLERRGNPVLWLTGMQRLAAPTREDVDHLPPEQRLPVLAGIVSTGAAWGRVAGPDALSAVALSGSLPRALPDLPALAFAVAAHPDLDPSTRRHASVVAAAALANGFARGAWTRDAAEAAARRVTAAVADLLPDPDLLTSDEAFRIDGDALEAFAASARRRANGPVLCHLAGLPCPAGVPEALLGQYTSEPAIARLLLIAGRPDAARRVFQNTAGEDTTLATDIAFAVAERHLAAKRPVDALHELASLPDPTDLVLAEDEFLERVAAGVVKERGASPIDEVLHDAEIVAEEVSYLSSVQTMVVELLLERTRHRPGSAALDVADLERAYEIDPDHPMVARSLAFALVVRGMETAETRPAEAVADVDRATDLYMADAQLAEMAAKVALHAGAILWGKQRNRAAAARAIDVSLAINPHNPDALEARRIVRGF